MPPYVELSTTSTSTISTSGSSCCTSSSTTTTSSRRSIPHRAAALGHVASFCFSGCHFLLVLPTAT